MPQPKIVDMSRFRSGVRAVNTSSFSSFASVRDTNSQGACCSACAGGAPSCKDAPVAVPHAPFVPQPGELPRAGPHPGEITEGARPLWGKLHHHLYRPLYPWESQALFDAGRRAPVGGGPSQPPVQCGIRPPPACDFCDAGQLCSRIQVAQPKEMPDGLPRFVYMCDGNPALAQSLCLAWRRARWTDPLSPEYIITGFYCGAIGWGHLEYTCAWRCGPREHLVDTMGGLDPRRVTAGTGERPCVTPVEP
jgi:hypothetical protein